MGGVQATGAQGGCLWLPQWVTERAPLYRLIHGTPPCKVNAADWFPGPYMPVNVGWSWCAELHWLPSLLGQQDNGDPSPPLPPLLCCITHRHPGSKLSGSEIKKANQTQRPHTHTPNFMPQAPHPQ